MFSLFQDDFVDDVVQFCTSVCSVARVYIYIMLKLFISLLNCKMLRNSHL